MAPAPGSTTWASGYLSRQKRSLMKTSRSWVTRGTLGLYAGHNTDAIRDHRAAV
jgi:hypothetical protein